MSKPTLRRLSSCLIAPLLFIGAGCHQQCITDEPDASVLVTVVDGMNRTIEDAKVDYYLDGLGPSSCEPFEGGHYVCGREQVGHFVIVAERAGVTGTGATDVAENEDGCPLVWAKEVIIGL